MAGQMGPTDGDSWMRTIERRLRELQRHSHAVPIEDKIMDRIRSRPLLQSGSSVAVAVGNTSRVSWSNRFLAISNGRDARVCPSGYFALTMPPNGQLIKGWGGAADQNVASGGIILANWHALYYAIPLFSDFTSRPENFHVVSYLQDFEIPSNWVRVAIRNGDAAAVLWG